MSEPLSKERTDTLELLVDTGACQENILDFFVKRFRTQTAHLDLSYRQEADVLLALGCLAGEMTAVYHGTGELEGNIATLAFVPGYMAAAGARLGRTIGLEV